MNPTLTSLISDVYALTNRPDLVSETQLAVRNATIKAHTSDYYYKDIVETGIKCDFPLTQQQVDYKTLIPRWRAIKYLRRFDFSVPPGVALDFLEVITPDAVMAVDSYHIARENVCYVAGLQLQIRTAVEWQYFLLGAYVHPDVGIETYSSWIADERSAAIVYEAAAIVFKTIGYDEQVSTYRQMVADEYSELKMTNILANGY